MAIRSGMQNLVDRLRAQANAGTAQYTAGTITYWTDTHLQNVLDRYNTWVVEDRLSWTAQNIGGTAQYFTAQSGYRDFEEAESGTTRWQVRQVDGTAEGTANYSTDYVNGRLTWATNQAGTVSFTLTGYSYDLYAAAVDVLKHKLAYVDLWYDFSADNQSFSRSQVVKNLTDLINDFSERIGSNQPGASGDIHFSTFIRTDVTL